MISSEYSFSQIATDSGQPTPLALRIHLPMDKAPLNSDPLWTHSRSGQAFWNFHFKIYWLLSHRTGAVLLYCTLYCKLSCQICFLYGVTISLKVIMKVTALSEFLFRNVRLCQVKLVYNKLATGILGDIRACLIFAHCLVKIM